MPKIVKFNEKGETVMISAGNELLGNDLAGRKSPCYCREQVRKAVEGRRNYEKAAKCWTFHALRKNLHTFSLCKAG